MRVMSASLLRSTGDKRNPVRIPNGKHEEIRELAKARWCSPNHVDTSRFGVNMVTPMTDPDNACPENKPKKQPSDNLLHF